jgi:hypothetical protein
LVRSAQKQDLRIEQQAHSPPAKGLDHTIGKRGIEIGRNESYAPGGARHGAS